MECLSLTRARQAHEGIMILPEDAKVGTPAKEYFNLSDVIFELEITPNRPDCLSHIGIARELAVYYDKELKMPNTKIENETTEKVVSGRRSDPPNRTGYQKRGEGPGTEADVA